MNAQVIETLVKFREKRNRLMGRLLKKTYRFLEHLATDFLKKEGYDNFRVAHLIILMNIDAEEGIMINSLSARCGVTKQAISKIIKELQQEGYVSTEKHPTDARAMLAKITDKGAQFMLDWKRCTEYIDEQFRDVIGLKRLELLKDILEEVVEHFETNVSKIDIDESMLKHS